jgi:hypothetical protein
MAGKSVNEMNCFFIPIWFQVLKVCDDGILI